MSRQTQALYPRGLPRSHSPDARPFLQLLRCSVPASTAAAAASKQAGQVLLRLERHQGAHLCLSNTTPSAQSRWKPWRWTVTSVRGKKEEAEIALGMFVLRNSGKGTSNVLTTLLVISLLCASVLSAFADNKPAQLTLRMFLSASQ